MHGQWRELLQLTLRDAAVLIATLVLWRWLAAGGGLGEGHVAWSVLTALLTTLVGYFLHEWGHLIGALLAGARFELPASPFESPFLFKFDRAGNSRPQFFAMALGGFASSILTVAALAALLPRELLATWLTLGLVAAGVAATFIIEVPEFWRVWRGGPIPNGAAFVSGDPPPA